MQSMLNMYIYYFTECYKVQKICNVILKFNFILIYEKKEKKVVKVVWK